MTDALVAVLLFGGGIWLVWWRDHRPYQKYFRDLRRRRRGR
jgi:hypothetical protein